MQLVLPEQRAPVLAAAALPGTEAEAFLAPPFGADSKPRDGVAGHVRACHCRQPAYHYRFLWEPSRLGHAVVGYQWRNSI